MRASLAILCLLSLGCGTYPEPEPAAPDSVSIGYGHADSGNMATAVGSVTAEETENVPYTRVEEMIAGRVAGVEVTPLPGGAYRIRIRGSNSFNAANDPLIVIDGVPVSQFATAAALASINPRDVARIDVLKDAASSAIYGSRGANGVILIRTKQGRR